MFKIGQKILDTLYVHRERGDNLGHGAESDKGSNTFFIGNYFFKSHYNARSICLCFHLIYANIMFVSKANIIYNIKSNFFTLKLFILNLYGNIVLILKVLCAFLII